jgi:hypothetical protein
MSSAKVSGRVVKTFGDSPLPTVYTLFVAGGTTPAADGEGERPMNAAVRARLEVPDGRDKATQGLLKIFDKKNSLPSSKCIISNGHFQQVFGK